MQARPGPQSMRRFAENPGFGRFLRLAPPGAYSYIAPLRRVVPSSIG